MQYQEFIQAVQYNANLSSEAQTKQAIQASLETLSERILGNEASELADQLPEEIGAYLRGREGQMGEPFSLEEFYRRVSDREGVDGSTAAIHARAVFAAISAAATPGEREDVKNNLPDDYKELFEPVAL